MAGVLASTLKTYSATIRAEDPPIAEGEGLVMGGVQETP